MMYETLPTANRARDAFNAALKRMVGQYSRHPFSHGSGWGHTSTAAAELSQFDSPTTCFEPFQGVVGVGGVGRVIASTVPAEVLYFAGHGDIRELRPAIQAQGYQAKPVSNLCRIYVDASARSHNPMCAVVRIPDSFIEDRSGRVPTCIAIEGKLSNNWLDQLTAAFSWSTIRQQTVLINACVADGPDPPSFRSRSKIEEAPSAGVERVPMHRVRVREEQPPDEPEWSEAKYAARLAVKKFYEMGDADLNEAE